MHPAHDPPNISQNQQHQCDCGREYGPLAGRMFHAILAPPRPFQHRLIVISRPLAGFFPRSARTRNGRLAQYVLVRTVVTDNPLSPERGHRIRIQRKTAPSLRNAAAPAGRWIKRLPAISGEVRFHPGMRILGSYHVASRDVVELVAAKPVDYARGNAERPQHDGHRRGEILAVTSLAFE